MSNLWILYIIYILSIHIYNVILYFVFEILINSEKFFKHPVYYTQACSHIISNPDILVFWGGGACFRFNSSYNNIVNMIMGIIYIFFKYLCFCSFVDFQKFSLMHLIMVIYFKRVLLVEFCLPPWCVAISWRIIWQDKEGKDRKEGRVGWKINSRCS